MPRRAPVATAGSCPLQCPWSLRSLRRVCVFKARRMDRGGKTRCDVRPLHTTSHHHIVRSTTTRSHEQHHSSIATSAATRGRLRRWEWADRVTPSTLHARESSSCSGSSFLQAQRNGFAPTGRKSDVVDTDTGSKIGGVHVSAGRGRRLGAWCWAGSSARSWLA